MCVVVGHNTRGTNNSVTVDFWIPSDIMYIMERDDESLFFDKIKLKIKTTRSTHTRVI